MACLRFERIILVAVGKRNYRKDRVSVEAERHLEAIYSSHSYEK